MGKVASNWNKLRIAVWERDGGQCHVCKEHFDIKYYECGHIVDRACGGLDEMDNLVVMCNRCNRYKPLHKSRAEYDMWQKDPPHVMTLDKLNRMYLISLLTSGMVEGVENDYVP